MKKENYETKHENLKARVIQLENLVERYHSVLWKENYEKQTLISVLEGRINTYDAVVRFVVWSVCTLASAAVIFALGWRFHG